MTPLWLAEPSPPDTHAAFRAIFTLEKPADIELRLLGASWFNAWLDGRFVAEGPARFPKSHPEYQSQTISLNAGEHVLAIQGHHVGLHTRLMLDMPPFVAADVRLGEALVPLRWRAVGLPGYARQVRRVNGQLGWVEWLDTRADPAHWHATAFDDSGWSEPKVVDPGLGELRPLSIAPLRSEPIPLKAIASGTLAEGFGYERDDPPARFFLRELSPKEAPPQGLWRRYDLGRVRLGRPRLTLDLPAGAVVECAVSESLAHGRVNPWVTLSASSSCNLWRFVARGGSQVFFPLIPLGGRFLEVHIVAPPESVRVVDEAYLDRGYHGAPEGSVKTGDRLLDRIWSAGVETYRACAEDALIDNPTRERGAWTGDAVSAGLDIAAMAYSDARLAARSLRQAAWTAREDGLVPGMAVGEPIFIPAYAAQWVSGCLRYVELTGDTAFLAELFPFAERNLGAFERLVTDDGLGDGLGWSFIDWGYVRPPGPADPALNLHYLAALHDLERWCVLLEKPDRAAHYRTVAERIAVALRRMLAGDVEALGYHAVALGLRGGFFDGVREREAIEAVKRHLLRCFPNDPSAPRLSDPAVAERRLITPYFAHYAFPPLIERGEMDFVLGQYRKCWGWMLETGHTTILEVFDTRWSHCHSWSACPTWQLSRYLLGLRPRFDRGARHYDFALHPGSLASASGRLPIPGGGTIAISWKRRDSEKIAWSIDTPQRLFLHLPDGGSVELDGRATLNLPGAG